VARTYALESLVIGSFLRGLSTRDVEGRPGGHLRRVDRVALDVSRILEDTRERYRRWCERRLDEHDVIYCFLDAIYRELHPDDEPAEGGARRLGVTLDGRKVLLGLQPGSRESYESWLAFGRDLVARGLRSPALIVADGAPGLWKAARELWPAAHEQPHGARAQERHVQAARASPSRAEGALVEGLRRRRLRGRGASRASGDHRRLPPGLPLGNGGHRARPRWLGRAGRS
jgi:hypothetical protein